MRSAEGITWWQPGRAPRDGWYWWDEHGLCRRPAEFWELLDLPLRTLQKGRQPLMLAESFRDGDWLKAWWDGTRGWTVGPCAGPSAPTRVYPGRDLRRAVERGGGELLSATPTQQGWSVTWRRGRETHTSQIDGQLNVLSAGFCLSGQDRIQDLTSLVSLIGERESHYENAHLWGGDVGW
ncbi:MAG: hypothetical protein KF760_29855 [Candidatus Eremiobacteraeota bacterium]|nr:hypothetical protein [Candidatus Eremiobacteraeota bacterium]MCW5866912.1 hypothetical protein [Candidatus Eremiobacteraeota bacterium]